MEGFATNVAEKLLHDLETAGGHIAADGGRLELSAPAPPADYLINGLRQHKTEVMRLISGPPDQIPVAIWNAEDWKEFFDERAAIAEFDGRLSRPEAEQRALK